MWRHNYKTLLHEGMIILLIVVEIDEKYKAFILLRLSFIMMSYLNLFLPEELLKLNVMSIYEKPTTKFKSVYILRHDIKIWRAIFRDNVTK